MKIQIRDKKLQVGRNFQYIRTMSTRQTCTRASKCFELFLFWKIWSPVGGLNLLERCFVNGFSSHFSRGKKLDIESFSTKDYCTLLLKKVQFIWRCIHVKYKSVVIWRLATFLRGRENAPQTHSRKKKNLIESTELKWSKNLPGKRTEG